MSCASCESPFSNYLIAARDRYNSLSNSSSSRIQLVGDTIRHMIPVVVEGIKATALERKNMASYDTGVRYKLNDKNQMVYASGSFAGLRPSDLHDRTARLNPDLYNPEDLKVDLATEAAFQARATKVISTYHRVGNDNRNINIYELDPETKIISLRVINTATDGNNHAYDRIVDMAKKQFADFNIVSPSGPNGPEDHVFVMSDVEVPREKIKETMGMSGIKENDLEIKETIMKFEAEAGKVYEKNKQGENVNMEDLAGSELERKQKHRLVGRIKSCFNCAVETGKTEAFFYAPKNLDDVKKDRTISQVLVDMQGNVVFKTINLSKDLSDSDLKQLLLKLGEPGKSLPVREFTYTDDPISDVKMKEIVKNGLAEISARNRFEFLSLRVFPIENRFDFLRRGLKTDRIVSNNPVMYFHDIALLRGVTKTEDKIKKMEPVVPFEKELNFSQNSLNALVVLTEGVYGIDRVVRNSVDEAVERSVFEEKNEEAFLILNQAVDLPSAIHRKKSRYNGKTDTEDDNDGDPSAPTTYIHVDREDDEPSRKYVDQENKKPDPKDPKPQSPTKMYLEEENLTKEYFFADPLVDGSLFQDDDQGRYLVREEIKIRQEEEESETVAKIAERTIEVSAERKNNFHYHDLNHGSEQAQKNIKLIFPEIKNYFPIGERVEMEKQQQEQMEKIWKMFLNLYFGVFGMQGKVGFARNNKNMEFVAEQEVKNLTNFFTQKQFLPYMRVLAIFLICILTLSRNI